MGVSMVILIIIIIIMAFGFGAFVISLIVKFFKWFFSPPKILQPANANPYVNAITDSDEFKQFITNRIDYWNKIIREKKSAGIFDETKNIYEEGEHRGIKYNIARSSGSNTGSDNSGADLIIKIFLFPPF